VPLFVAGYPLTNVSGFQRNAIVLRAVWRLRRRGGVALSEFKYRGPLSDSAISRFLKFNDAEYHSCSFDAASASGNEELVLEKVTDKPYIVSVFKTSSPYYYERMPQHIRENPVDLTQIRVIKRGSIEMMYGREKFFVRPNEIVLYRINVPQRQTFDRGDDFLHESQYIHIPTDMVLKTRPDFLSMPALVLSSTANTDAALKILDIACQYGSSICRESIEGLLSSFLSAVMAEIAVENPAPCGKSQGQTHLDDIINFLNLNYSNSELRLNDVSRHLGVSTRYIARVLSDNKMSFSTYLNAIRLGKACNWVDDASLSDLPLAEICFRAGFNSYPHFSTMFRRQYGTSPMVRRKLPRPKVADSDD
jgi:AraC-like DNA-binding protein